MKWAWTSCPTIDVSSPSLFVRASYAENVPAGRGVITVIPTFFTGAPAPAPPTGAPTPAPPTGAPTPYPTLAPTLTPLCPADPLSLGNNAFDTTDASGVTIYAPACNLNVRIVHSYAVRVPVSSLTKCSLVHDRPTMSAFIDLLLRKPQCMSSTHATRCVNPRSYIMKITRAIPAADTYFVAPIPPVQQDTNFDSNVSPKLPRAALSPHTFMHPPCLHTHPNRLW